MNAVEIKLDKQIALIEKHIKVAEEATQTNMLRIQVETASRQETAALKVETKRKNDLIEGLLETFKLVVAKLEKVASSGKINEGVESIQRIEKFNKKIFNEIEMLQNIVKTLTMIIGNKEITKQQLADIITKAVEKPDMSMSATVGDVIGGSKK